MGEVTFIVDLARCTGCDACRIACKDRAGLPDEVEWLRVEAHEAGAYPNPTLTHRIVHCFHCTEPPCVDVCPVEAISKGLDGVVRIDPDECTGCEACIDACPFGAILLVPDGVAAKCDGCADEVRAGWQPTCVRACPTRALGYSEDTRRAVEDAIRTNGRELSEAFDDYGAGPGVVYLVRPPSPLSP